MSERNPVVVQDSSDSDTELPSTAKRPSLSSRDTQVSVANASVGENGKKAFILSFQDNMELGILFAARRCTQATFVELGQYIAKYQILGMISFPIACFKGTITNRAEIDLVYDPTGMLNDEAMNALFGALEASVERGNIACIGTHFYLNLSTWGYERVANWFKPVDSNPGCTMVFIPVNVGIHWILVVINLKDDMSIDVYDSFGQEYVDVATTIQKFLKKRYPEKTFECRYNVHGGSARQGDGSSCGIFALTTAILVANRHPVEYGQSDISVLRRYYACLLMQYIFWGSA